jgi:hypothetical protein
MTSPLNTDKIQVTLQLTVSLRPRSEVIVIQSNINIY